MGTRIFHTDREFHQQSFDVVARLVFDRASVILSNGNPVHNEVKTLLCLSNAAAFSGYSNTVINTFYTLLDDENSKNDYMEGWNK